MAEDKGVITLIRAWRELKTWRPKLCPPLWLAGGTPEEIELIRQGADLTGTIDNFEQEGLIQWWGYLDPPGLSALLTRACVLLTHSLYEPGGRVIIEAMAQGVPVIATPNGFAKDLIKNWRNGFLVEFGDKETLILRMSHFILQPLLRNSLGAEAREDANRALAQWNFMDIHCQVYDMAAGQANKKQPSESMDVLSKSDDFYRRRRLLPTYPCASQEPDTERVKAFTEQHTGCRITSIHRIDSGPGSSTRWRLTGEGGKWIVKWPYSRLVVRTLWDPFCRDRLITPAEDRFAREVFSETLPCFCPWTANDPNNHLLLRPAYQVQPATCEIKIFAELADRYRKLQRHPLPLFGWAAELERDWRTADAEEILELRRIIHDDLAESPWAPDRHVSLRLAWREAELALERSDNPLARNMPDAYRTYIDAFSRLAEAEAGLAPVVCHGSGDLTHCLRAPDGFLFFIDGEHVHPSQPGEDMAAIMYFAIEDSCEIANEERLWPAFIEAAAVDRNEQDILLAWAGLFALDETREQCAMLGPDRAKNIARWETLARLALERINR